MAAGGRLAFGSDWPVVTLDPRTGIHTAVTRTTVDGLPEGGWYPAERIPLTAAVDAYTSGAAWASFDEQRKGRLARDLLADVVILSSDIFQPDAHVMDAVVETTIFDGKVVYTPGAIATRNAVGTPAERSRVEREAFDRLRQPGLGVAPGDMKAAVQQLGDAVAHGNAGAGVVEHLAIVVVVADRHDGLAPEAEGLGPAG